MISIGKASNFNTRLYNYLAGLQDSEIFSRSHVPPLKYPADILINQYILLNKSIENLSAKHENSEELEVATRAAYLQIDTFYDNLFNIIKCLKLPNEDKEPIVYMWLKTAGHRQGETFFQHTNLHHQYFSTIANIIKHDDPRVLRIRFEDERKSTMIDGFYFSSLIKDNKTGPDPRIHKHYNNQRTANSINFVVKKIVAHAFWYDDKLSRILGSPPQSNLPKEVDVFRKTFMSANNRLDDFFVNEYLIPTGVFSTGQDKLLLDFPRTLRDRLPKNYSYKMSTEIETNKRSVETSGYLPYFGTRIE